MLWPVADFGFARELDNEALAQSVVGSPLYMVCATDTALFRPLNSREYNRHQNCLSIKAMMLRLIYGQLESSCTKCL